METIISTAFDFFLEDDFDPEEQAEAFNRILVRDGYRLECVNQSTWMEGDREVQGNPCFHVRSVLSTTMVLASLTAIRRDEIREQIFKVKKRIMERDYSGAIASSYTLTEHLLKLILREEKVSFNENDGDIRALYKLVSEQLNLNPGGDCIARPLKPILDGLQKLVAGLYEISNKASDRHASRYKPAVRHAKLAVNAAFALCEFLVESRDYRLGQDAHTPENDDRRTHE